MVHLIAKLVILTLTSVSKKLIHKENNLIKLDPIMSLPILQTINPFISTLNIYLILKWRPNRRLNESIGMLWSRVLTLALALARVSGDNHFNHYNRSSTFNLMTFPQIYETIRVDDFKLTDPRRLRRGKLKDDVQKIHILL